MASEPLTIDAGEHQKLMDTQRELPAVLYKYMPAIRSQIFDDWLIRFTQPKALNDPFEMRPHISGYGTPEQVREIATRRWEEHARETYDELVRIRGRRLSFEDFRARIEHDRAPQIEAALRRAGEHNPTSDGAAQTRQREA